MDRNSFSAAIRNSDLSSPRDALDVLTVEQLFDLCTSTTILLLDMMPFRCSVRSRLRPLAVWFDGVCHQTRRRASCGERRYRRSIVRRSWITQLRGLPSSLPSQGSRTPEAAVHRPYHHKEAAYWEQLVSRYSKDPLVFHFGTSFPTISSIGDYSRFRPRLDVFATVAVRHSPPTD